MEKKKYIVLLLQIAAVAAAGVIGGDTLFALVTALIGITFNFMVSMNFAPGFLIGFVYAICNGILAWQTKIYATFVFMIFMQAPMALYSFWKWRGKKKQTETIIAAVLSKVNGTLDINVFFDTFFFVCSAIACIGLAACYKNAYIVNLGSGIGGTILWVFKAVTMGTGISVAVFFLAVAINAAMAIRQQYGR